MIFTRFIILFLLAVLLTSCGDGNSKNKQKKRLYGAKNIDEAEALFFQIEAIYQVIETGELLEFDFVVSCYNRDVPGSFHGMLMPTTMFMATRALTAEEEQAGKKRPAIAIAPPKHYCQRGLSGHPIVKENDMWKMPTLAWYSDVNDLSFALIYVTNDAYTGTKAKVKFLHYAVRKTNRASFQSWQKKAKIEYKQIGAIPGPYGCSYFNTVNDDEYDCAEKVNRDRNNNHFLVLPKEGIQYARKLKWPDGYAEQVREYLDVDNRYFCNSPSDLSPRTGKKKIGFNQRAGFGTKKLAPKYIRDLHSEIGRMKSLKTQVYLDPDLLMGDKGERTVREVYPALYYAHPLDETEVEVNSSHLPKAAHLLQILEQSEWKGFTVSLADRSVTHYITEFTPPPYTGANRGVLMINDNFVCENFFTKTGWNVIDLEHGYSISTSNLSKNQW